MHRVYLVLFIILWSPIFGKAQVKDNPVIDSLITVVTSSLDPCENVATLYAAGEYYKATEPVRAYNFFLKSFGLAKDCNDKTYEINNVVHLIEIDLYRDLEMAQSNFLTLQELVEGYRLKEEYDIKLLELFVLLKIKLGDPDYALDLLLDIELEDFDDEFKLKCFQLITQCCLSEGKTDSAMLFYREIKNLNNHQYDSEISNLLLEREIHFQNQDYIFSDSINNCLLTSLEQHPDLYLYLEALIKKSSFPKNIRNIDSSIVILTNLLENSKADLAVFPDLELKAIEQLETIYREKESYHKAYFYLKEKKKFNGVSDIVDKLGSTYHYGGSSNHLMYLIIIGLLLVLSFGSFLIIKRLKRSDKLIS
jgi:tetratricopeptide (TPR) repeat protein